MLVTQATRVLNNASRAGVLDKVDSTNQPFSHEQLTLTPGAEAFG